MMPTLTTRTAPADVLVWLLIFSPFSFTLRPAAAQGPPPIVAKNGPPLHITLTDDAQAGWKTADRIAVGALVLSFSSLGVTIWIAWTTRKDAREDKRRAREDKARELLYDSLKWFEGKTQ